MNPSPRVILSLAACSACGLYDISDKFDGDSETAATTHLEVDPSTGDLATSTSTATTTSSTGTSTSAGTSTTAPWDTSTSSSSTSTTEDPPPPGPKVAPDACKKMGSSGSWVFVTPFRVYGDLSPEGNVDSGIAEILNSVGPSLTRADKTCQLLAHQANLAGQYVAWLSGSSNIKNYLEHIGTIQARQFVRLDGLCVADTWATWLSLNHQHPINRTHTNFSIPSGRLAWTGTWESGATAAHCHSWSKNNGFDFGRAGKTDSTSEWSRADDASPCSTPHHLYCLQYAD